VEAAAVAIGTVHSPSRTIARRARSPVAINVPAHIRVERIIDGIGDRGSGRGDVVLEATTADCLQKPLEVTHLDDTVPAKSVEPVVGEAALADIGRDPGLDVVCRDATVGEGARRDASDDGSERILLPAW
jgi:hypothetical protein